MRIVSWNMNNCLRSHEARQRAWEFLRNDLRADIALVQEANPPAELGAVYRPIDVNNARLNWGSAIISFRPDLILKPRPRVALSETYIPGVTGDDLPDSHPGACAVTDVIDSGGNFQFTAVSLYGQWETIPDGRIYSCARLHRMISDLTGVLATSRRRPVVIAGDFNVTTQIAYGGQTQAETDGAVAVFSRLQSWGLADCFEVTSAHRPRPAECTCPAADSCTHVRTFRLKNSSDSRPTQLDYAYISKNLVSKLQRCDVVHTDDAWALSDHCPVVLDFAETAAVKQASKAAVAEPQ
jgi:exonuclease III